MTTTGENCRELGRPLVEVFSVTINNIKGDSNTVCDISGKIEFSDGLSISQSIYDRGSRSESIRLRDSILLTGPARCITADDDFSFKVDLNCKEEFSDDDDEIIKDEILWEVMNISANKYDQLLRHQVNGQNGASATVNYAVLRNAVQARIEITLLTPFLSEAVFHYGNFTAHTNKIGEKIVLSKGFNSMIVKPGEKIPLSRSVVAVPLTSDLIVSSDLEEVITFHLKDERAINGQATFSARLSGTNEQYISFYSLSAVYKVKVTWDWYVF